MESYTVFDWPMKHKTVRVKQHFLRDSINAAGMWLPDSDNAKPLVIVLATPSRLSLYATWIDELTMTDLQILGLRSGENYRPYQRYSDEELKKAVKDAELHGNTPDTDDDGRPLLWLPCYTYSYDKDEG